MADPLYGDKGLRRAASIIHDEPWRIQQVATTIATYAQAAAAAAAVAAAAFDRFAQIAAEFHRGLSEAGWDALGESPDG